MLQLPIGSIRLRCWNRTPEHDGHSPHCYGIVATTQLLGYTVGMAKLTNEIRKAVKASDQTAYAIAKGAKIARSQMSRMLSGENEMKVNTIERLADYLGLRIKLERKKKTTKGR